jgi:hypothetical protein
MPTFIFDDDFSSYTLGPGIPNGFAVASTGGSGEFDQPTPPPTPAPGFYEQTGKIFKLSGGIDYPATPGGIAATAQTTVWWTTLGIPDTATAGFAVGLLNLSSQNPSPPFAVAGLLQVILEADYTLSVLVNGATKANTLVQAIYPYTWQIIQLIAQFGVHIILGVTYVAITFSLVVNGEILINAVNKVSSTPVSDLWDNSSDMNQWQFTGGGILGANTYFSEIAATADIQPIPSYPSAGAPNALVSQMAVDVISVPSSRNGRATQLIVEAIKQPSNRDARVSQMIVELIKKRNPNAGGGWLTYEA